ncbi:MAG: hypothetical protein LBU39_07680 [Desulfobulbaceae bacterium]|jgi:hypothetical protein|nr:hypothetical protein [Desulfobulbaceae bacterium]
MSSPEKNELDAIFAAMPGQYLVGLIDQAKSYYFSLGENKKTVRLDALRALVEDGKTLDAADCVCKTSAGFFIEIWRDGRRPSLGDFLGGAIKSNDPAALETFLRCFGKG